MSKKLLRGKREENKRGSVTNEREGATALGGGEEERRARTKSIPPPSKKATQRWWKALTK
jgi:hypothetical protein